MATMMFAGSGLPDAIRNAIAAAVCQIARRDAWIQENAIAHILADGWTIGEIEIWQFTDGRRFQIRERETESVLFDGELPPLHD